MYLEPWHADVFEFLDLKKNHGDENARARDLFYALWTPDLFMARVKANGDWTLFNPDAAPGLADVHGAATGRAASAPRLPVRQASRGTRSSTLSRGGLGHQPPA